MESVKKVGCKDENVEKALDGTRVAVDELLYVFTFDHKSPTVQTHTTIKTWNTALND